MQNQKLAELRDWLLPMLMNGQVSVAKVAEHANVKLARVASASINSVKTNQLETYEKIKILYAIIWANKIINIKQGEMATAKDVYLLHKIFGIKTNFKFARHNWGSF